MNDPGNPPFATSKGRWHDVALQACTSPGVQVKCPNCGMETVSTAWHLAQLVTREAAIDLNCHQCKAAHSISIVLPPTAPSFFPLSRIGDFGKVIEEQFPLLADRVRQHGSAMPAAGFTTHPLWAEARWSATAFRWHPASEAPPIMGIVFDNAVVGKELFRQAAEAMCHRDEFEEIRVSIIEGATPGQEHRPGYTIHICPDPESLAARATVEDVVLDPSIVPFLGQWNRHYPVPGSPKMLPKFKMEFQKHREFLLAPAVRRQDGQLWFEPELGIVKTVILFRNLSEITPDDPDAAALVLPQIITPPE